MSTENLLGYTEYDLNNHISVTAARATFSALARNEDAYLYSDKGANYFDGYFEFKFTGYLEDNTSNDDGGMAYIWSLANLVDDVQGIITASGDLLGLLFYGGLTADPEPDETVSLVEVDGGVQYLDSASITVDVARYFTVQRDENVGTYGTLYCFMYSDAARTNLLATLSIALHTSKKDFRYNYAIQSSNTGDGFLLSGWAENYNIDLGANTAEKRKSAAVFSQIFMPPGVTPNASKDQEWRQEAAWSYSGILAGGVGVGGGPTWIFFADN